MNAEQHTLLGVDVSYSEAGGISITVDKFLCKGCGICIDMCPKNVYDWSVDISKKGVKYPVPAYPGNCSKCRLCELLCPDFAISVVEGDGKFE